MGATLRVNPDQLLKVAAAQEAVATFVSGLGAGQPMASAGTGMSGLLIEQACQFAGSTFDTAARAVHDELTSHSTNLAAAADQYLRTDEQFGRRLRALTE
jgi:hypothetical protein